LNDPEEQRRESLADWDAASTGWERGRAWLRDFAAPVTHWLIEALELQPGERVLDLAAGPGETGLLAAELILPGGVLISSDQSEAMVELARARAAELKLSNVEFRVINAESIDLPVASIDAVLCRWGYMLMVDPSAAMVETRRVLKAGGRVSLAVWGSPSANPWLSITNRVIQQHGLADPPTSETAPGPFALSDAERLRAMLEEAGFVEIEIDAVDLVRTAPSFREWWEMQLDMSPSGPAVRDAPSDVGRAVAAEVEVQLAPYTRDNGLLVPARSIVAAASA
jgi:ubiquinone/menaquinone biosynthesis C-methylase UbiE